MQVRIGDIVRFISEKLEGKVTGIVDQYTVNVYCDEYGFEIPASVHDLVVIHSDFKVESTSNHQVNGQKSVNMESTTLLQTGQQISSQSLLPSQTDLSSYSRIEPHFSQTVCLFICFAPRTHISTLFWGS